MLRKGRFNLNYLIEYSIKKIIEGSNGPDLTQNEIESLNSFEFIETSQFLLKTFLNSENDYEKSRAFDGLMHLAAFDRSKFLTERFGEMNNGWQDAFMAAMAETGDYKCIKKLLEIAIDSHDPDLRYQAVSKLGNIGGLEIIESLSSITLNDTGEDFEGFRISDAAIKAIQEIQQRN